MATARSFRARVSALVGQLSLALAAVALIAAAWASYVAGSRTAPRLEATPSGYVVGDVAVGSSWWARGVRSGMPAVPWTTDEGRAEGYDLLLGDSTLGVGPESGPVDQVPPLVATALVLAALSVKRLGLPGYSLLLVAGVTLALVGVFWRLGLPWSLPFVGLPVLTAVTAVTLPDPPSQRLYRKWAALALGVLLVGAAALTTGPPVSWAVVWVTPGIMAFGLIGLGVVMRLRRLGQLGAEGGGPGLLTELVPLAQHSHLAGRDAERNRLAAEVHYDVLPRVSASLQALQDRRDDQAAEGLRDLMTSLRGLMQDRQLIVLEAAGLVTALSNHAESLRRRGVPVSFTAVEEDTLRPPAMVEVAAYRIAHLAVENAISHARASRIEIRLTCRRDDVELLVIDDGAGGVTPVVEQEAVTTGHLGLAEMRQRAARSRGILDVFTNTDGGTTVRLRWKA